MSDLPEGWTTLELRDCVDVLDSARVPVNSDERSTRQGTVPYYGATGQVGWIDDYLFDEELLLIGEGGAPFFDKSRPIAYLINGKAWVNNHAHVLRANAGITTNAYLKYFLDQFDFHEYVNGTTRLKLSKGALNRIPVSLSPKNEQQRIVAAGGAVGRSGSLPKATGEDPGDPQTLSSIGPRRRLLRPPNGLARGSLSRQGCRPSLRRD